VDRCRGLLLILVVGVLPLLLSSCREEGSNSSAQDAAGQDAADSASRADSAADAADAGPNLDASDTGTADASEASSPDAADSAAPDGAAPDADASNASDAGSTDAFGEAGADASDSGISDSGMSDAGDSGMEGGGVYLCGWADAGVPTDAGAVALLADLGPQHGVVGLWQSGDRVLAQDSDSMAKPSGWVLWDTPTGQELGGAVTGIVIDLEGSVFAVLDSGQVQVRYTKDASLATTIVPGADKVFGLASDGSYVWGTSTTDLSVWSNTGSLIGTRAGDYSLAKIFASPNVLNVALGPAGANVIEYVQANGGASTTSSSFSGSFHSWFLDGGSFISTVGGTNIFAYKTNATLEQLLAVTEIGQVFGQGLYLSNFTCCLPYLLDIYQVGGNGQPVASYNLGVSDTVRPSADRIGLLTYGAPSIRIVHVDSQQQQVTDQSFSPPYPYQSAFAYDPAGYWSVGNEYGSVYYDGTVQSPGQTGQLGCGQVLGMAVRHRAPQPSAPRAATSS
jgi:hypothetical protein